MNQPLDLATQSNYLSVSTSHVHFDWSIDWTKRVISGSATHTLIAHQDVNQVIFDSSHLDVQHVEIGLKHVNFDLRPPHHVMGSALVVPVNLAAGETTQVKIDYSTTEAGTAVGWLEKEQTAGKKFDYLYSQCQPIYARCLAPLQDTPSVKLTYSANVRSVLPVLMSALRVSPPSSSVHNGKKVGEEVVEYVYNQPIPIPSYIIAIASGNVIYRSFPQVDGKKYTTGVWTEPEAMEASYWEFCADTANFVVEAEKVLSPNMYEFGVFDLLVLPPSFPYGGMENACLTFVTPTLLAGDRSLVDTVGHEISHSWFGNNVTTADSGHFWLNEGWTTWLERVLRGALHGPSERDFSYIIGRKSLLDALKQFDSPKTSKYQRLVIDYEFGEDPDDAYSRIPYEKGSNFLLYLERLLGGLDVFIPYARDYVATFRGKSIRTDQWKAHLYSYFEQHGGEDKVKILDSVDWNAWLYGEGLDLPVDIAYDVTLANDAYNLAERWRGSGDKEPQQLSFEPSDLDKFNSHQKVVFLEHLAKIGGAELPVTHLQLLDTKYGFNSTTNVEIRLRWYNLVLLSTASQIFAEDAAFWLVDPKALKGRMKFCRPVFRGIYQANPALAKDVWLSNSRYFHPIARKLIEKDLGLAI